MLPFVPEVIATVRLLQYDNATCCVVYFLIIDANKKLQSKETELVETQQLNAEYQVKLHSDDLQFIKSRSEINFWERKCESQSKELTKLNDAIAALRSSNQALEERLSKGSTDLDCDNKAVSDEKVRSVSMHHRQSSSNCKLLTMQFTPQ